MSKGFRVEDLLGASDLIKDVYLDLKHSQKKVLGLSFIAIAMGMYRP